VDISKKKILIIVPAYNEEDSISQTLENLLRYRETGNFFDICVVNDGSKDNTSEIVKNYKDVILLELPHNLGIGGAVQTGYKFAYYHNYDIAVQFDADGQHNILDLNHIIEPLIQNEADMVVGSRFLLKTDYKGALARRVGIIYFSYIIKLLTGNKITDPTSGYRAINNNVLELFADDYPKDYPEPEVLIFRKRKKLRIKEVSVNMSPRQGGSSSITAIKSIYYMAKVTLSILMQKVVKER
jgi:glycosyltransferase involved in cell wall biosynthesis